MGEGKSTWFATLLVGSYVVLTAVCMGLLFRSWQHSDSAPLAGMAHALTAMWYAAVGLVATAVTLGTLFFVTHGLRHILIAMAVLCVWLTVMGATFKEEIRYAVNPGSFQSYQCDVRNESTELIEGNVVGVAGNGMVVFTDYFKKSQQLSESYSGLGISAQPPERMPQTVVITWWKGWTKPPAGSAEIIETRIAWPADFSNNQTVVFVYQGTGQWSTRLRD